MQVVVQLIYSFLIQAFLLYILMCMACCVAGLLQDLFHELGKAKGVSSKLHIHFLQNSILLYSMEYMHIWNKYQMALHNRVHLTYELVLYMLLLQLGLNLS
jgi:hypothetical protein